MAAAPKLLEAKPTLEMPSIMSSDVRDMLDVLRSQPKASNSLKAALDRVEAAVVGRSSSSSSSASLQQKTAATMLCRELMTAGASIDEIIPSSLELPTVSFCCDFADDHGQRLIVRRSGGGLAPPATDGGHQREKRQRGGPWGAGLLSKDEPQHANLQELVEHEDPLDKKDLELRLKVNELAGVRLLEAGEMGSAGCVGEFGAFARRALRRGELVPFAAKVSEDSEDTEEERHGYTLTVPVSRKGYVRGGAMRGVCGSGGGGSSGGGGGGSTLLYDPDPQCAGGYVNDAVGPDRSPENVARGNGRKNVEFLPLFDKAGVAHIFWRVIKPISEGDLLWGDYGASYWAGWEGRSCKGDEHRVLCRRLLASLDGCSEEFAVQLDAAALERTPPSGTGSGGGGGGMSPSAQPLRRRPALPRHATLAGITRASYSKAGKPAGCRKGKAPARVPVKRPVSKVRVLSPSASPQPKRQVREPGPGREVRRGALRAPRTHSDSGDGAGGSTSTSTSTSSGAPKRATNEKGGALAGISNSGKRQRLQSPAATSQGASEQAPVAQAPVVQPHGAPLASVCSTPQFKDWTKEQVGKMVASLGAQYKSFEQLFVDYAVSGDIILEYYPDGKSLRDMLRDDMKVESVLCQNVIACNLERWKNCVSSPS
jgi:hypothetical protein